MAGPLQRLVNRSPVPYAPRARSMFFGDDGRSVSRADQLGQMEKVSTIFSIADLIATKVASVDWHLYERTDEAEADRTEVFRHPALSVWETPATVGQGSDRQVIYTQDEFVEACQQHFELTGEMDIVLERRSLGRLSAVTDMWPVRPDRLEVKKSRDKFIAGYVYRLGDEEVPLSPNQVIRDKRQNPLDPYRGLSPVGSLILDIRGENAAAAWNANFFTNGAVPGGTLELGLDAPMADREWQEMVDRWRTQHQGTSNAHRVAVIEMGKYSENKISQRDMEFTDLRQFSRESMMEAYRISKAMLGHVEDVNRSTGEAQMVIFTSEIIVPRLERWKKLLNRKLLPYFGPDAPQRYEFDYDSPVPKNAADMRLQERADVLNAIELIKAGADWGQALDTFNLPAIPREYVPASMAAEDDSENEPINVEPGTVGDDPAGPGEGE